MQQVMAFTECCCIQFMELSGFLVSAPAQRLVSCLLAAIHPDAYSVALATCYSPTTEGGSHHSSISQWHNLPCLAGTSLGVV